MMWFLGFVVTFTVGGMTGVLMSVPAADFQLHNTLFLVAHFHNMIIGGVVFGFFAAMTYWFPKIFGFRLNERLGRYAFWCWLLGFLTAFLPLYALGFLGATRRLDHYDPSMGWQGLFVVAAIGVGIICLGVVFQILQVAYSVWKRKELMDTTGDPWDGRTLEWATSSPPAIYNFAQMPAVNERDAFWEMKQAKTTPSQKYEPIELPKNTPLAMVIAAGAFIAGFAIIWHMWLIAALGVAGIIVTMIIRSMNNETEYTVTIDEIARIEKAREARI